MHYDKYKKYSCKYYKGSGSLIFLHFPPLMCLVLCV